MSAFFLRTVNHTLFTADGSNCIYFQHCYVMQFASRLSHDILVSNGSI